MPIFAFEAESVSFAVCAFYDIDTGANSFGYLASWSKGKELTELKSSLETINKTAGGLIKSIDQHFKEVCRERGIDLSVKEGPEKDPVLELAAELDQFSYDYDTYEYWDSVENREEGTEQIVQSILKKDVQPILEWLADVIEDADEEYALKAKELSERLAALVSEMKTQEVSAEQKTEEEETEAILTQNLDEYPLPDASLRMEDLEAAGYRDGDMLPISKDKAGELLDKGLAVYAVADGGSAEMISEKEEIDLQEAGSLFAVSKEDWEGSTDFHAKIMERQEHQEEREQAFLSHEGDCFAIYQVREDTVEQIRFMGLDWLELKGIPVERMNYDLVYTGQFTEPGDIDRRLESLYEQFNLHHPADYHSPSLSVSDIIAVKQSGVISCHYCDRIGFQEIPGFIPGENYLKAAEMTAEDDYGMIDGIINNGPKERPTVEELERQMKSGQPISLMDLADAVHREQAGKKKSVVKQLKSRPGQKQKKTAQKQREGREL